jgi:hypothetical protein
MLHPIRFVLLAAALAAGAARADETLPDPGTHDAARQERMNEAWRRHQQGEGSAARAVDATKRDARQAGHEFHQGLRATGHAINKGVHATGHAINKDVHATGHAINKGVHATGHAIHQGLQATGHVIHRGVDKIAGK